MYTLLESCLEKLEIFEFINYVENGLRVNLVSRLYVIKVV